MMDDVLVSTLIIDELLIINVEDINCYNNQFDTNERFSIEQLTKGIYKI